MTRTKCGNSINLQNFMDKENLFTVFKDTINNVAYTYKGANSATPLIDHFIVSEDVTMLASDYFTLDSVNNLSDHVPQDYLKTSDYEFGFKSKSSMVLCSTIVNETIQYYIENGGKRIYLSLFDATKAFHKVSYKVLFDIQLENNVCPRIVNLLHYMYYNQLCHVKCRGQTSVSFSMSNGVKQGGVISPLLFSLYIDELFSLLKQSGLGCDVGLTYAGAFVNADDIALVASSLSSLKQTISICKEFAKFHSIVFNPSKPKLLYFNLDPLSEVPPIYLNEVQISVVEHEKHLGNYVSTDISDRNIIANVCDLYQRSNLLIVEFRKISYSKYFIAYV